MPGYNSGLYGDEGSGQTGSRSPKERSQRSLQRTGKDESDYYDENLPDASNPPKDWVELGPRNPKEVIRRVLQEDDFSQDHGIRFPRQNLPRHDRLELTLDDGRLRQTQLRRPAHLTGKETPSRSDPISEAGMLEEKYELKAQHYRRWHYAIQIFLMCASVTVAGLAGDSDVPRLITVFSGILVSALTGVTAILKLVDRVSNHQQAAMRLHNACSKYKTEIENGIDPNKAKKDLTEETERIKQFLKEKENNLIHNALPTQEHPSRSN